MKGKGNSYEIMNHLFKVSKECTLFNLTRDLSLIVNYNSSVHAVTKIDSV